MASQVQKRRPMISAILISVGMCYPAHAVTINFEDQPLTVGGVPDTRTISTASGAVTFSGGEFVSGFGVADLTTVYATVGPGPGEPLTSFTDTLTITFQNPVTNFSVLALGLPPTPLFDPGTSFTVSDNAGHTSFGATPLSGFLTLGLDAASSVFTITGGGTSSRAPAWDFAIDNVSFETPAPVPLPAAFPLFASGLGMLGLLGRWRKHKAQAAAA